MSSGIFKTIDGLIKQEHKALGAKLRRRGFDRTRKSGDGYRVACSQCEALVINGVATHERGCPNQV